MDFYVFIMHVLQYGEDAFARSKNKPLVVLKKNKKEALTNSPLDPKSEIFIDALSGRR